VKVPDHWKVVFHVQDLVVCIILDVTAWTGRVADVSLQIESSTVGVMAQGVVVRYIGHHDANEGILGVEECTTCIRM
jgi:hypothetical protein